MDPEHGSSVGATGMPPRRWLAVLPYALLVAVGLLVLLPRLGGYGLWDPWEPKYAESAREMSERGSYIVPYYLDSVRLTKPILVYWGVLAGSAVFGLNEFGVRIVGVVLALVTLGGVYYGVSTLRGRQAGLISALVLGTAPQFYFIARQAMPDVYLFTTQGICLLFFCLGLFGPDRRRNLHFGISYACFALAVLAKGPVIIGTVFLTTLAIFTFIRIDLGELWRPGRRFETLSFSAAIPSVALCCVFGFIAYLFGTSRTWWGFSKRSRESTEALRDQIREVLARLHVADLVLVLVVAGAVLLIVLAFRGRRRAIAGESRGAGATWITAVLPGLVALAAVVGLGTGNIEHRILAASVLGACACLYVTGKLTWRFLHQDWLWPIVQPYMKPVGRQLLLFLVVFLVVAGPWHLGIFVKQHHGYVTDFLIKHNINRAGQIVNRTGVSEFYVRVLIFGLYPWSCFLPVAIASLVGWWKRDVLKRRALEVYLLIATLVTFAAFTISATKFAHYLSPILVPACVLIGLVIHRTLEQRHTVASRLAWIVAAMLFLLPTIDLLDEGGFTYMIGTYTMKRWVPASLAPGLYYDGLIALAGVCLLASIVVRSRVLLAGLVAAAALMGNHSSSTIIPELSRHKTMKHLCEEWKRQAPGGDPPICFFGGTKHGAFFYTENRIRKLRNRMQFQEFMDPDRPAYCIVERGVLPGLQQSHRLRHPGSELSVVESSHYQYVLVRNFEP
jgi:4-amino-4-deoxy-L-arabinose transferase-like glycosyltransferase